MPLVEIVHHGANEVSALLRSEPLTRHWIKYCFISLRCNAFFNSTFLARDVMHKAQLPLFNLSSYAQTFVNGNLKFLDARYREITRRREEKSNLSREDTTWIFKPVAVQLDVPCVTQENCSSLKLKRIGKLVLRKAHTKKINQDKSSRIIENMAQLKIWKYQ